MGVNPRCTVDAGGARAAAGFLLLMVLALGRSIAAEAPLGHDESVYALGARAAAEGTPDTGCFGTLLSALAIMGLVYGLWIVATRYREQRGVVFIWIVAFVHTGATGLLVHGEPRYI